MEKTKKKVKKKPKKNGRPSKYRPEMANALIRFFDIEPHYPKDMTITKSDGTRIDKTVDEPADVPFFYDFCKTIDITTSTFDNWTDEKNKDKYPGFFEAYKKAWQLIEKIVTINAMRGLYSTAFAIFYAKNKFGWRDTQHIDAKGVAPQYHFTTIAVKDLTIKSPEDLIGCFRETVSKIT